jgi:hypothetical protein
MALLLNCAANLGRWVRVATSFVRHVVLDRQKCPYASLSGYSADGCDTHPPSRSTIELVDRS